MKDKNLNLNLNQFSKLIEEIKKFLKDEASGHDFHHSQRVFKNAAHLQNIEGGDEVVIGASAIVHDICRPLEKKTGKSHFGNEALKIIRSVLQKSEIEREKIESILEVVKFHDVYDWTNKIKDKSIELKIIQDADNLDAMGAIGIARTFAFGGAHGLAIYNPGENVNFENNYVEDPKNRTSTIAHFYEKLLRLKENMNTRKGMELAEERHMVMEKFLHDFFNEWEGKFE